MRGLKKKSVYGLDRAKRVRTQYVVEISYKAFIKDGTIHISQITLKINGNSWEEDFFADLDSFGEVYGKERPLVSVVKSFETDLRLG